MWDVESAKQAIRRALQLAREAGRRTALTLSDTFCVERHKAEFRELLAGPVDVVFANRAELFALYDTTSLDEGTECLRADVELGCITLGKEGSILVTKDETIRVGAEQIAPVVDTTGAGDQYAAGVLFGLARGFDLAQCGYLVHSRRPKSSRTSGPVLSVRSQNLRDWFSESPRAATSGGARASGSQATRLVPSRTREPSSALPGRRSRFLRPQPAPVRWANSMVSMTLATSGRATSAVRLPLSLTMSGRNRVRIRRLAKPSPRSSTAIRTPRERIR
ncbi:MAG: PfkB family carbohydrate kinase [Acidimicrobiales bacterium]